MKKIEIYIRPKLVARVQQALNQLGITGMSVIQTAGIGRQQGYTTMYRGVEEKISFLGECKIEIIVDDDLLNPAIDAIMQAARTGEIGDGKILVTPIEQLYRIRTGEQGTEAI